MVYDDVVRNKLNWLIGLRLFFRGILPLCSAGTQGMQAFLIYSEPYLLLCLSGQNLLLRLKVVAIVY